MIVGFEKVLKEIGTSSSFLGAEETPVYDADFLWNLVFTGILNEKSQEGKLFKENISIEIAEAEALIKQKIKHNLMQFSKLNYLSFDDAHKSHGNCGFLKKFGSCNNEIKG